LARDLELWLLGARTLLFLQLLRCAALLIYFVPFACGPACKLNSKWVLLHLCPFSVALYLSFALFAACQMANGGLTH